jgi:hypothetical protein
MRIIKVAKLETLYTGVMSPLSVHRGSETPWKGLLERFPIPEGWTTYGHHMTINLGQAKNPELLGKDVSLTVTALGQDENAIALQVESSVPIQGAIPHITLATAPSSEPKQSNNIQNWKPIQPFQLTGTIAEIGSGGKVITDEVRELEEIRIRKEKERKQQNEEDKKRKRKAENDHLQGLGFERAKEYLHLQFPHLPEQAILGKLKGAGLTPS